MNKYYSVFLKNIVVFENYIFMTLLQVLNSLFYLLIYPYLISVLGIDNYGFYIFATSIISYFISFVNFGFDLPGLNEISKNSSCQHNKENVLSCIFTAKVYLNFIALLVFFILAIALPTIREVWHIYAILFLNTVVNIMFPVWFFQSIQKMRLVTYIQLGYKLLSLPFIFLFVNRPDHVFIFSFIIMFSNVAGGLTASFLIIFSEKLTISWMQFRDLKKWYKYALPFFWSNIGAQVKQQSMPIIIGSLFGFKDVSLYDLAYKIMSIPNILFSSVNSALFIKIAQNYRKKLVTKIFQFEVFLGLFSITMVVVFGKWVVLFLGGTQMLDAYPIAVVLSFGILTLLLVGAYINFIFVPQKKYYLITQNQVVALILYFIFVSIFLLIYKDVISVAIAWSLAGLCEILYCKILIKKYKLF
jgi:PST family polysaccharide transporter